MESNTYLLVLTDTLKKKNSILDQLLYMTLQQEKCLQLDSPDFNMDQFDQYYVEKEDLITKLNQLDEGFERIYHNVKQEFATQTMEYKEDIIHLQELIRQITDKSAQILAAEQRNKKKLDMYLTARKKEIRKFHRSSQTVSSYYKSMTDGFQGDSLFLDKKK